MRQLLGFCLILTFINANAQVKDDRKVSNLETFAKLYGYVRYFHPSDEADTLNWNGFAVYGSGRVMNAASEKELLQTLQELFAPVAPTVKIFTNKQKISFDKKSLEPADTSGYLPMAWQHIGVGGTMPGNIYRSLRINRPNKATGNTTVSTSPAKPAFSSYPLLGETVNKDIGSGLKVIVPLALYGNSESTYPAVDKQLFNGLQEKCTEALRREFQELTPELRAGSVIIAWNIFRHFFPYWEGASKTPEEILRQTLQRTLLDKSMTTYMRTLRLMTAPLNDGHINVYQKVDSSDMYTIPLLVEYVEGKVVVERVLDETLATTIQSGDVVIKADGLNTDVRKEELEAQISGSPQWKESNSRCRFFNGWKGTNCVITLQRGDKIFETKVKRDRRFGEIYGARNKRQVSGWVKDGIYYVDLNLLNMDSIKNRKTDILAAKGVIFDLRGYPKSNHEIISWLMHERDTTKWMFVPQITYPDFEKVTYYAAGWGMAPSPNTKLNSKVVFITDGRAISYAESFMGHIKDLKLATIVGAPTAGTNGNVNTIELPGGYNITWTGMLVKNHDGSRHHLIGIVPDVPVQRTVKGIAEGRDEFLEKAISVVSQ